MNLLKNKINKIINGPGIYQFINKAGKIIYIGKSVNLKSRVNSYFNSNSKLNFAKIKMVKQIVDIKTIITNNETESLILETTLIKKHQPKYNILMKDGKNYIYLKITKEIIPRIIKTRIKSGKGMFFGPYISTGYVNRVLKVIKKNYGFRTCNLCFLKDSQNNIIIKSKGNTKIPCMDYYIKTCSGPCLLKQNNIKKYLDNFENIKYVLKGNNQELLKSLETKMIENAKKLNFEEASSIKKTIESIKGLEVYQIVREGVNGNYNIINYLEKFDKFFIGMIEIKNSKIIGFYNYEIKNELNENKELVIKKFLINSLLSIILKKENNIPNLILPFQLELNEEIFNSVNIEVPKIGTKKELLDLCYKNTYEYGYKSHINSLSTKGFTKKTMQNILDLLGYKQINKTLIFEANDISHISGNYTVASRSIIENGKSNTSKYKKFKIKTLEEQKIDDFGSIKEIMIRRIKEIEKIGFLPDLIIIDGGKGQLNSVINIIKNSSLAPLLNENNEKQIQIVSIAKREEELFLPGNSIPIILDKDSQELRLIQKIRDESHRFAISFNRDSRNKAMKKNILESLPGFGPKTRIKLFKKYQNIENIQNEKKDNLLKIINKAQLETLIDHGII